MNLSAASKSLIAGIICYLYILLFVYAAVSKLTDFQNFRLQIAQSPLLTAYAGFIAISVLVTEFVIAIMLAIPRLRSIGLYGAFTLMMLFSVYIFIILNYSPYIPCSCGGILEKMGWEEHLAFNAAFVLLAAIAILGVQITNAGRKSAAIRLVSLVALSAVLMWVLFITSENIVHHRNNFVRRIPQFAAMKSHELNLDFNSYYIAGADQAKVYLGNLTAPSIITTIDTALGNMQTHRIDLDDGGVNFSLPQLKVTPPYFFVYDGNAPVLYNGAIRNWRAKRFVDGVQTFTKIAPVDSTSVIFRAATKQHGNILGIFDSNNDDFVNFRHDLLQKQVDGFFDTDGAMHYSAESERFVYLYFYRNQYIVTDKQLKLIHRGNTIDTTTKAKIKTEYNPKTDQRKFSAPPHMVNRSSALHRNLLFVHSTLQGKYDPKVMQKHASVVDVYDINKRSYLMSFYVYKVEGKTMDVFVVSDTHLFAQFGKKIVTYRFNEFLMKEYY